MLEKSISEYFLFGARTRYLQDAKQDWTIHEKGDVLPNLDGFLNLLETLELQVTSRAAAPLRTIRTELAATSKGSKLNLQQASALSSEITSLRKTLHAEIEGFKAYVVTPKRLDIQKLLHNVPKLFADARFNKLPPIAQLDFTEAGKCIAFERPTAAAFHLLRGTEDVLRKYYEITVKQKRITSRMWGPIVIDLRKKRCMASKEALLNNLDNIRNSFRNPTQHPEMIYGMDEVQDLWSLCIDVVNRMSADFK